MEFCRIAKILQLVEFLQPTKFRSVAKLPISATVHLADHYSLSCDLLLFNFFCYIFGFLPILSLVIAFDFGSFCNFAWLGQYISSNEL